MPSILDQRVRPEKTPVERKVDRILNSAANLYAQLKDSWESGVRTVWQGETEEILQQLGTNAAELFRVSAATAAFLEVLRPGSTTEVRALMRAHTVHEDGTVTLDTP